MPGYRVSPKGSTMAFERYVTALDLDERRFLERETVWGCRSAMDAIQLLVEQSPGGLFSLKPGWVHLLVDTLGVEVQLGGTPYATLRPKSSLMRVWTR